MFNHQEMASIMALKVALIKMGRRNQSSVNYRQLQFELNLGLSTGRLSKLNLYANIRPLT